MEKQMVCAKVMGFGDDWKVTLCLSEKAYRVELMNGDLLVVAPLLQGDPVNGELLPLSEYHQALTDPSMLTGYLQDPEDHYIARVENGKLIEWVDASEVEAI